MPGERRLRQALRHPHCLLHVRLLDFGQRHLLRLQVSGDQRQRLVRLRQRLPQRSAVLSLRYTMIRTLYSGESNRSLPLGAGLLLGFALALATAGYSWEAGAVGLGFALAALVGLAQTCSA